MTELLVSLGRTSCRRSVPARIETVLEREVDDLVAWDRAASAYAEAADVDWFDGFLERHLGDVAGKRVLDLGCGHGWFTHELHQRGAHAVGVDGSAELIRIAGSRYPDVEFRLADLREGIEGEFDVVVALMVLMDVPVLDVLRPTIAPGGMLVATILHPAFFNQKTVDEGHEQGYRQVRQYLDEEHWWINSFGGHRHYHRPISTYVEWLASLGLGVVELFEPTPTTYEGWRTRIPTRLGLAARRVEPDRMT